MRARIFIAFAALSATAYACGGVDSDLVGSDSDSGSGGEQDSGSPRRDGGSARDGSIAGDAGSSDGGSSFGDASAKDSGVHDGGVIVHPDGGFGVPAVCGNEADGSTLSCTQDVPTCCANQADNGGAATSFACTTSPATCTGTSIIPVACRDDRDCSGGRICCGTLDGVVQAYDSVQCVDSNACNALDDAGSPTNFLRFCTPGATDSVCTDAGSTCTPSSLLPGFNHC